MAFNAIDKTPGVYIDEIKVPGPIPGVGTSTAAFIGPAKSGPINTPTFLTNWSQFARQFGDPGKPDDSLGPYVSAPPVYVTHAVRGFFDNGGASCYFVRVATAARASLTLKDRSGTDSLVVTAKQEGKAGNEIKVEIQNSSRVASVKLVRLDAEIAAAAKDTNVATLDAPMDPSETYLPGDRIKIEEGPNSEVVTIASVSGTTLTFNENLTHDYTNAATSRIADIGANSFTRIRLESIAGIEPGTYIEISQAAVKENAIVESVEPATNVVRLAQPLTNSYTMSGTDDVIIKTLEFTLIVTPGSGAPETYSNLSMDPRHSRYFRSAVISPTIDLTRASPPGNSPPPKNLPAAITDNLEGGKEDDISMITTPQYLAAIAELEKVDNVNMLCIPDRQDQAIQAEMLLHCEKMEDRFAIFDPRRDAGPSNGIKSQRLELSSERGFGALYYPWIEITGPLDGRPMLVPPSGHVAGVYARTDETRGVFKPPANESIRGAIGLERVLADDENGPLNEEGVNVIRSFPGRGILVWGARTITPKSDTQWRYVNVRRLLLFIEESIQEGTQFAVFEPNNEGLWATLKRQVSDFLTRVWRDGGLVGATPDKAFRVRIDHELNPPDVVALGQLIIEVRVAPVTPAEFVVFRIISTPGKSIVQE